MTRIRRELPIVHFGRGVGTASCNSQRFAAADRRAASGFGIQFCRRHQEAGWAQRQIGFRAGQPSGAFSSRRETDSGVCNKGRESLMKIRFVVFSSVAAITLAVVCLIEWKENADLKRRVVSLQESVREKEQAKETDEKKLQKLKGQSDELNRQLQTLTGELQTLRAAATPVPGANTSTVEAQTPAAPAGAKSKGLMGDLLSKMMDDPNMKKMMRQQQGAMMDMMYGGLFKDLGLTPEETDKFKELLLDRQMKAVEAGGAFMKLQGADTDKTEAMNQLAAQQKESEAEVKAFLGDERYAQYKDY